VGRHPWRTFATATGRGLVGGRAGLLESLWIGSLAAAPIDESNRFSRQPAAAALGTQLFFDTGLSSTGTVACSTCHDPGKYFADGKRVSEGTGTTTRNAPSLLGASYHKWFYWDGRRDSLWAQALAPMNPLAKWRIHASMSCGMYWELKIRGCIVKAADLRPLS
jgi:cytochrome c peroxidase